MNFPDTTRLTTLSTGAPGLRGSIHVQILKPGTDTLSLAPAGGEGRGEGATHSAHKSVEYSEIPTPRDTPHSALPEAPILDFVSSDETLDRYSEIITASGWRLDSYRKNPVFQNAHQYGDIIFTIGKALITEVRQIRGADGLVRDVLYQRIEFAVEANPIAKIAYALYRGAYISTVSVGLVPIRWEDSPGSSSSSSSFSSSSCRRRYLEQELLEVSAVAIPANPNALALALKSGAVERATLAETIEILRSTPAAPQSVPILRLMRELHGILTS